MLGSLHDAIRRLEYSFTWENTIPCKTKTVDYYFDEVTADQLQVILNDLTFVSRGIATQENYCSDCGGSNSSVLTVVYKLTDEEKQEELNHCLKYRRSAIKFITGCLERNPDQAADCIKVLERKNLLDKVKIKACTN